jgi:Kef-type K+ transport system membrane component KefB
LRSSTGRRASVRCGNGACAGIGRSRRRRLDAIGYGFLVPVFFVTSGLTFNLSVLFSSASTLLRVPLFLLALLVVRGLPAVLYWRSRTAASPAK